jgi:hypothetical protein
LRISAVDPRERHRGVSHHSLTSLGRVALSPADLPVPILDGDFGEEVRSAAAGLCPPHRLIDVPVAGLVDEVAGAPIAVSTMGRSLAEDPAYFLACAAAGRHAATLLDRA